ncbi:hypothetical protein ALC56_14119, partial [Trachymyrmex septentrionalis]
EHATREIKRPSRSQENALKNIVKITGSDWSKIEDRGYVRRGGNDKKMIIQEGRVSEVQRYRSRGGLYIAKGTEIFPELEQRITLPVRRRLRSPESKKSMSLQLNEPSDCTIQIVKNKRRNFETSCKIVMKKSKSFVQKWVQRYNVAKNVDDLPEHGSICKVDKKDYKKIVNLFSRNLGLTLRQG